MCVCVCVHTHTHKGVQLKFKPDLPHYDRVAAACVIAQQYSSATFVTLRFHSRREKFDVLLKQLFQIFYFIKNFKVLGVFVVSSFGSVCSLKLSEPLSFDVFFSSSPIHHSAIQRFVCCKVLNLCREHIRQSILGLSPTSTTARRRTFRRFTLFPPSGPTLVSGTEQDFRSVRF